MAFDHIDVLADVHACHTRASAHACMRPYFHTGAQEAAAKARLSNAVADEIMALEPRGLTIPKTLMMMMFIGTEGLEPRGLTIPKTLIQNTQKTRIN